MTENTPAPVNPQSFGAQLAETGVLGVLLGKPIADAIGQLIGSATSIPATYLEGVSQRIRDDSEARTRVTKAIAEAAANSAIQNHDLVERSLDRWISTELRKQANREKIAQIATNYIIEGGKIEDNDSGPNTDFMNRFGSIAEDASSEDMQHLFARILAGECRKPGSFSLAALNVFSLMDNSLASAIEKVNSWVFDDWKFILFTGPFTSGPYLNLLMQLSDFSLVRIGVFHNNFKFGDDGTLGLALGNKGFILRDEPGREFHISTALLTPIGEQVMSIIPRKPTDSDIRLIGEQIKLIPIQSVRFGDISERIGVSVSFEVLNEI
jgi:hypothetical protein